MRHYYFIINSNNNPNGDNTYIAVAKAGTQFNKMQTIPGSKLRVTKQKIAPTFKAPGCGSLIYEQIFAFS